MLRSVIETNREILTDISLCIRNERNEITHVSSCYHSKNVMVGEEVGVVRSSCDDLVMRLGAKGPYLVDVNREVSRLALAVPALRKEMRWLINR